MRTRRQRARETPHVSIVLSVTGAQLVKSPMISTLVAPRTRTSRNSRLATTIGPCTCGVAERSDGCGRAATRIARLAYCVRGTPRVTSSSERPTAATSAACGSTHNVASAGGSIPPWFEGGQTPLHMRIPKLRSFKNRFRIEYEVVNVGRHRRDWPSAARSNKVEEPHGGKTAKSAPVTVQPDILRAVGLVRTLNKPLKILGAGDLSVPLFVVADAFTASARAKIEGASGVLNVLEMPGKPLAALGVTPEGNGATASAGRRSAGRGRTGSAAGCRARGRRR